MGVEKIIKELRSSRSYAVERRNTSMKSASVYRERADQADAEVEEVGAYIAEIDLALSTLEAAYGQ